jgi:hypothetical protein
MTGGKPFHAGRVGQRAGEELVRNEQASVAERPVALPPEFEERVMLKIRAYNAAAAISLADYAARALCCALAPQTG